MVSALSAAVGLVVTAPLLLKRRVGQEEARQPGHDSLNDLGLIRRSEWGAVDPDLVTRDEHPYDPVANPSGWMVYDEPLQDVLDTIVVHHSALPLSDGPREIQALHMVDKGFADVGYHFMIDEAGKLYEGRMINVRGAHTARHNTGAIGIVLMGNFMEIEPAPAQLKKLEELVSFLVNLYSIENLAGHRDYNPGITLCPGDHLAVLLPALAEKAGVRFGL